MTRKIGSHDLEVLIQRPHQRDEVFELRAKGVQEQDRRTLPGAQEAELGSEDTDALCIQTVQIRHALLGRELPLEKVHRFEQHLRGEPKSLRLPCVYFTRPSK